MSEKKRVLLIEDDESVLKATKRLLQALDCEVVTATNFIDGRGRMNEGTYALIISDNQMPIGSESRPYQTAGIELLAHAALDAKHKGTPLVLYTGASNAQTMDALKHIGAHYMHKPSPDFAKVIGKLLEQKS